MKIHTMTSLLALATVSGISVSAVAQDGTDQVTSVYERYRPDFTAPGARSGSFLFNPTIEASGKFDSNIFAQRAPDEVDDFIWQVKPGFRLVSDWNRNFFSLYADADIAKYSDNGREDYEDFTVGMDGRLDISRGTSFNFNASFADLHEDRGSPDNIGAPANQTTFSKTNIGAGFVRDLALVSLAIEGDYEIMDFDSPALVGGGFFNNEIRNRDRLAGSVRLGYEIDQYYETFVQFSANRVEYDDSTAAGGPQRNSDGWEVVAGATFDITGTSQGEIFGGYIKQNYDSDSLEGVDDFTFGASLLWNPSGLTSVRGTVSRTVTETIVSDVNSVGDATPASGILGTLFDLQLEHELQRNVLLKGSATYIKQDFQNTLRDDDLFNATVGATYLLNRNFSLNADYTFNYRDTTARGQDFKRHIFMVGLTTKW